MVGPIPVVRLGWRANEHARGSRGADGGTLEGHSGPVRFERSLQIDNARDAEGLLAYAMNGEPCQRPSVFARYSTIADASASDASAPRATIASTMASQSFSLMRWLVTTSLEWQPAPHAFATKAFAPPGGSAS